MDTNEKKFQEQVAPEKNTDHAFVQVGSDGQPVMPQTTNGEKKEQHAKKENQRGPNK